MAYLLTIFKSENTDVDIMEDVHQTLTVGGKTYFEFKSDDRSFLFGRYRNYDIWISQLGFNSVTARYNSRNDLSGDQHVKSCYDNANVVAFVGGVERHIDSLIATDTAFGVLATLLCAALFYGIFSWASR